MLVIGLVRCCGLYFLCIYYRLGQCIVDSFYGLHFGRGESPVSVNRFPSSEKQPFYANLGRYYPVFCRYRFPQTHTLPTPRPDGPRCDLMQGYYYKWRSITISITRKMKETAFRSSIFKYLSRVCGCQPTYLQILTYLLILKCCWCHNVDQDRSQLANGRFIDNIFIYYRV